MMPTPVSHVLDDSTYRDLVQSSNILMFITDTEGNVTFYNKAWLDFRGRTLEEEQGMGWAKGVHPDHVQLFVYDTYLPSVQKAREYSYEYKLQRYDGKYRWILEHAVLKYTKEAKYIGMVGTCTYITSQKEYQERLLLSENKFQRLADLCPVMIFQSDERDQLVYCNAAWEKFRGRTRLMEYGKGWQEGIHTEDLPTLYDTEYLTAVKFRMPYSSTFRFRRADGLYRRILESAIPIYNTHDEFEGYVGTCVDMEELASLEEKLNASSSLIKHIQEHTPDLMYILELPSETPLYCNKDIARWLGTSIQSINLPLFFRQLAQASNGIIARNSETYLNHLAKGVPTVTEIELPIMAENAKGWFLVKEVAYEFKGTQTTKVLGILSNITDRKRAELLMLTEQEFKNQIAETSPNVIYVYDLQ